MAALWYDGASNVAEKPPPEVTTPPLLPWHTISPSPGDAHDDAYVAPTAVTYGEVAG